MARSSNVPKRDQRLQRQERDSGAPDDDVYSAGGSVVYHDDRDCIRLKKVDDENVETDTRAAEQRRWKSPCLWCVLDEQ